MYFLYVDESGQTAIKQSSQDNGWYILSGVLVHEKDWKYIENRLDKAKQELLPKIPPREWELHAHAIWNNRGFFANEEFGLSLAKKEKIFSKVIEVACKSEITVINVIIFKDHLMRRRPSEVMKHSWRLLVSGFDGYLHKMPTPNNGLIFMDSSQRIPEGEIRRIMHKLVGGSRRNRHHVLENPIFVESHMWNLVQLADMIAYVMHRHCKKDPRFEKWFKLLLPKMYHSGSQLYGYGIRINRNYSGKQVRTHAEELLP